MTIKHYVSLMDYYIKYQEYYTDIEDFLVNLTIYSFKKIAFLTPSNVVDITSIKHRITETFIL